MSTSEDVSNLFKKFGGTPEDYQEIGRQNQTEEAKARWPLLSALKLGESAVAPAVDSSESAVAPLGKARSAPAGEAPSLVNPSADDDAATDLAGAAPVPVPAAPSAPVLSRATAPSPFSRRPSFTVTQPPAVAKVSTASGSLFSGKPATPPVRNSLLGRLFEPQEESEPMMPEVAPPPAASKSRELRVVFGRLAGKPVADGPATAAPDNSLSTRLSRL